MSPGARSPFSKPWHSASVSQAASRGLAWIIPLVFVLPLTRLISCRSSESSADAPGLIRGPLLHPAVDGSVVVAWRTAPPQAGRVRVYGPEGSVKPLEFPAPLRGLQCEATLTGLPAGQRYRYEVFTAAGRKALATGTFTTAPPQGVPFEFTVWGDSRDNPTICRLIADQILDTQAPLTVHSGDFVTFGPDLKDWETDFFEPTAKLLREVILLPAIGNHELGRSAEGLEGRTVYDETFPLPGGKVYFSFDYGDVHFLVLDSNYDLCDDPEQYAFAEQDLLSTNRLWKVVVLHHPFFCAGNHDSQVQMRRRYASLLARANIDLLVAGHDHNYQRSRPIRHHYEPLQQRPYLQIVSGGGGAPLYDKKIRRNTLFFDRFLAVYHWLHIRVEGSVLTGRAIDTEGREIDSFVLDKESPPAGDTAPYELIELEDTYALLGPTSEQGLAPAVFGCLLEPDQTRGQAVYNLPNLLPVPISIRFSTIRGEGVAFDPLPELVTIPGGDSYELAVPFQWEHGEHPPALKEIAVTLETPLGSRQVELAAPPIGRRRIFEVPFSPAAPQIDGQFEDAEWQEAASYSGLTSLSRQGLEAQKDRLATTVRLKHDGRTLYVGVRQDYGEGKAPSRGPSVQVSDRLVCYLGNGCAAVIFEIDADGRTAATTRPADADADVRAAVRRTGPVVVTELAFVLPPVGGGVSPPADLRFNLAELRRKRCWSLSPTMGRPPDHADSGILRLAGSGGSP